MNEVELVVDDKEAPPQKKRTCYRYSRGTDKETIKKIHQMKMEMKKQRNKQYSQTGYYLPIRQNRSKRWEEDGSQPNSAE